MEALQYLLPLFTDYGYLAVFLVLLICGFGVPIPEDITLVAGGIIAGLGYANVHTMFMVGMAGVLLGDTIMFFAGYHWGQGVLRWRWVARLLTPERYAAVQDKFARYGNRVLFVARFLPGLRSPIFLTAGMSQKIPYWRFLMLDGFAALISVPIWVYLGHYGAYNHEWLLLWVKRGQTGILLLVFVALVAAAIWAWRHHRARRPQS
ncbi:Inner membrane protein [Andreprevotia sp. IGB-42]|uniref:DedA family protein n=1 Tax=Andreprevotia sp. IGB-42 TaxID=2497473 RepID=UPI00135822B3|nr:DedA family protein [Andreprevotia sp. IGB-42]KAF0811638.1 Inner membrane protein [Andreprevotia sp. IGB-42]